MPQTQIQTQNNYSTSLTTAITTTSGDITFQVAVPPVYPRGFMVIGSSNPEIVYYHAVSGNTISVAGPNRRNSQIHAIGDPVQINDVAEMFNLYADLTSTTFYPEIVGMLQVRVFGGPYYINGTYYDVADKFFAIPDNDTTYIYLRYSDNTLVANNVIAGVNDPNHPEYGSLLHTITSGSGRITSVRSQQPRIFIDESSLSGGASCDGTPTASLSLTDSVTLCSGGIAKLITVTDFINGINTSLIPYTATFTQASPSYNWSFTHNLDTENIHVSCYTLAGQLLSNIELQIIDSNTVNVNFDVPTAGRMVITAVAGVNNIAGSVNGAANVGTGSNIFKQLNAGVLEFYRVRNGTNITVGQDANGIYVNLNIPLVSTQSALPTTGIANGEFRFVDDTNTLYRYDTLSLSWSAVGGGSGSSIPTYPTNPPTGSAGDIIFNSTTNLLYYWNTGTSSWSVVGGVAGSALSGLSDVAISSPVTGQTLVFNTATGKWENQLSTSADPYWEATVGTGGSYSDVTAALAAGKKKIILISNVVESSSGPLVIPDDFHIKGRSNTLDWDLGSRNLLQPAGDITIENIKVKTSNSNFTALVGIGNFVINSSTIDMSASSSGSCNILSIVGNDITFLCPVAASNISAGKVLINGLKVVGNASDSFTISGHTSNMSIVQGLVISGTFTNTLSHQIIIYTISIDGGSMNGLYSVILNESAISNFRKNTSFGSTSNKVIEASNNSRISNCYFGSIRLEISQTQPVYESHGQISNSVFSHFIITDGVSFSTINGCQFDSNSNQSIIKGDRNVISGNTFGKSLLSPSGSTILIENTAEKNIVIGNIVNGAIIDNGVGTLSANNLVY